MLLGFLLGQAFPGLQHNIEAIILLIVAFSLVPMVFEWWRHKKKAQAEADAQARSATSPVEVRDTDPR
jgi:membrane-associated protein